MKEWKLRKGRRCIERFLLCDYKLVSGVRGVEEHCIHEGIAILALTVQVGIAQEETIVRLSTIVIMATGDGMESLLLL